ncbi:MULTISPECIES: hypothetical protein [Paenibacillus]|jgi:hypothetical protein|uniref:Uncharacterized protein n=1 Tax=Paenibacillus oceani TaxID=2772510 RepID=A0A927CAU4_9BACL|nr:hypothetical protein [Paenibacillus oceani]MBD2864270.1 hypothetical protein [Paenibacillus oceani]
MEALSFMAFSMLEWFSLIILSFTMFKIEIRGFRGQIVFTSFLLSLLSYILIVALDLVGYATFLQPPIVFIFYWQMFRIPAFYAGLIMTNGYLAYIFLTSISYIVLQQLGSILVVPDTTISFANQSVTALVALLVAYAIYKYRIGYTFVPYYPNSNIKFTKINTRLLLFTIMGYLALTSFNFLYFLGNYTQFIIIPITVSLVLLQYWVLKKEFSDDH